MTSSEFAQTNFLFIPKLAYEWTFSNPPKYSLSFYLVPFCGSSEARENIQLIGLYFRALPWAAANTPS